MLLPKSSSSLPTIKCADMMSIEGHIAGRKLLFFARIILREYGGLVSDLFSKRLAASRDSLSVMYGFIPDLLSLLHKYDLECYLRGWLENNIFPPYATWKSLVWSKVVARENLDWTNFVDDNPKYDLFNQSLTECGVVGVWRSVVNFPDLRKKKCLQLRLLMGGYGLCIDTGAWAGIERNLRICPLCKTDVETVAHFLLHCQRLNQYREEFWNSLTSLLYSNTHDAQ